MAKVPEKRRREANIAALLTVIFVAMFAAAFIGAVVMLDAAAVRIQTEEEIELNETAIPTEPFYVLLIGSDSRKGTALYTGKVNEHAQVDQHSDIMTLMRIDPLSYKITLVTIPRDTVVDGQQNKINSALADNDPTEVVEAVGELTGTYADYYMMVSFISFENLINAIGGIEVDVPETISVADPATGKKITVKAGKDRKLTGSEALVLARARKEYGDYGDIIRQANVRKIESAIIGKVLALDGDFDVEHALSILNDDTKTNIDLPSVGPLMADFVEHAPEVIIYECTGPYEGLTRQSDGMWVVPEDEQTWTRVMDAVNAGEDPTGIVEVPTL